MKVGVTLETKDCLMLFSIAVIVGSAWSIPFGILTFLSARMDRKKQETDNG